VDLSGWVGVGLGGNCDCRCGILYAAMLGGFAGLVSLTSTPCPFLFSLFFGTFCSRRGVGLPPGFCYVCVRSLGAFGFLWEREQVCEMYLTI